MRRIAALFAVIALVLTGIPAIGVRSLALAQDATPAATPTIRGQTIALNGADIYYVLYGSGTPVVLVHGGFAHGGVFSNQIPALVDAGYQVIVFDSRGHGHSSHGP